MRFRGWDALTIHVEFSFGVDKTETVIPLPGPFAFDLVFPAGRFDQVGFLAVQVINQDFCFIEERIGFQSGGRATDCEVGPRAEAQRDLEAGAVVVPMTSFVKVFLFERFLCFGRLGCGISALRRS